MPIHREFRMTFDRGPVCIEVIMPYTFWPGEINSGTQPSIEVHPSEAIMANEEDMAIVPPYLWEAIRRWICETEHQDGIEKDAMADVKANDLPMYRDERRVGVR